MILFFDKMFVTHKKIFLGDNNIDIHINGYLYLLKGFYLLCVIIMFLMKLINLTMI